MFTFSWHQELSSTQPLADTNIFIVFGCRSAAVICPSADGKAGYVSAQTEEPRSDKEGKSVRRELALLI